MKSPDWHFGLLTAVLLTGCTAAATQDQVCDGQRIMITFASGVDMASPGLDAGLAHDAGVPIKRMRHLFEDHYLYCTGAEGETSSLENALERLRKRPDIHAVETDRIKHPENRQ